MPTTPATSEMLSEMSACAYRLGMAFGAAAERAEDGGERLEMFGLFERCFFAVRVATALQLRLRREGAIAEGVGPETERPEAERAEAIEARPERERFEGDRERDRETERASLPLFLNTLQGVAAEAAALPSPLSDLGPAELPALQQLLARASTSPARPPPPRTPLRDRLAGSAALALSGVSPALRPAHIPPTRRATGPPRR
ncbi:hypothetical protein [Phenylobacterium soli]|uniref:hypothetical protein n=1 Tax=Phenylobacterium soli TaxID=2170551 RepID=UPI003610D6B4